MQIANYTYQRPALYLAPMDDVTDAPFRALCKSLGADITISEFIASDALIREVDAIQRKLKSAEEEHPFGIQIFGNNEESLCQAAQIAASHHPDFIDINWGCPAKKIAGKNAGSGMLQNIPLLLSITRAVVKSVSLPVTVKTRVGYNDENKPIVELCEQLQDIGVQAVSIHGRTKTQMYKGAADWELIRQVKSNPRLQIPVIGNGDITTPEQALARWRQTGVDGLMIGRGAIGNPWIFRQCKALLTGEPMPPEPDLSERARVCEQHFRMAVEHKGAHTGLLEMRKHYKPYFKGVTGIKEFKLKLLTSNNPDEILQLLETLQHFHPQEPPTQDNLLQEFSDGKEAAHSML